MVELVVVMTIIAIISLISVSALLGSKKQAIVDSVAEELISTLRESQNKAISVMKGKIEPSVASCETKVWGVLIENNNFNLISYKDCDGSTITSDLTLVTEKINLAPYNTEIVVNSTTVIDSLYVSYATPFGKAYMSQTESTWLEKLSPVKDWAPSSLSPITEVEITIKSSEAERKIKIKQNGDVYAL